MRSFLKALQTATGPLMRAYAHFNEVLLDGHYGSDNPSIWSFLTKDSNKPSSTPVKAGTTLFSMSSQTISQRYILPSLVALLSVQLQIAAVVTVVGAVGGLFAFEYLRCKKLRRDIITEVNVAGQTVRGTRGDLARLHRAQANILDLATSFRPASIENTSDTISDLMESVEAERRRVQVLQGGHWQAGLDQYHFSRQLLGLVELENENNGTVQMHPAEKIALPDQGMLTAAFAKPKTPQDVVDHMLALESALPDSLRQQFRARLMQQQAPANANAAAAAAGPAPKAAP